MMMGFGFGGLGLILMVLFWIVIIVLAVWLVSRLFPQVTSITSPPARHIRQETDTSSEEILRRRYAAGEITKDEYEDMREELRK